eukprot:6015928-Prymnesium_polylepis.1
MQQRRLQYLQNNTSEYHAQHAVCERREESGGGDGGGDGGGEGDGDGGGEGGGDGGGDGGA